MEGKTMSVKTATAVSAKGMPGKFIDLVTLFPPHVIRDEGDYNNVIEFMDKLLMRPKLTKGQTEFFETWTVLIGAYEDVHHAIDTSDISGLDALKHLLEHNDMTASDLGELLGNRSLGSKILRGERELSKTHLRILADRFKVDAGLFL
jgi:HTH-type transcriptional regulator/antitoxin HigA